jgi:hypothetical protein
MADSDWTDGELSAAVEAYLQMLGLEQDGRPYSKAVVVRGLMAGPLIERKSIDFRLQNISYVLQSMGRPWIAGYKPLKNTGARVETTLRKIILALSGTNSAPMPILPPPAPSNPDRKLPPTGYWMFVCNRKTWDGEGWLQTGETDLLYRVSEHNASELQVGDLGVLRLNAASGTKKRPAKPAAVYALLEVMGPPALQSDPDGRAYSDPAVSAEIAWRAPVRIMADLSTKPVVVDEFPDTEDFKFLKSPLPTSTMPLSRRAYSAIFDLADVETGDISIQRLAQHVSGVQRIEGNAAYDPKQRSRISKYIERGSIGAKVKAFRNGRCQICAYLGGDPVAFLKKGGEPYAEAHHVFPVAKLKPGSLAATNIMVLCPNHHREAHHGSFEVVEESEKGWRIKFRDSNMDIDKTYLPDT